MLTLVFASCFNDVDDTASSPYAILKSFSIGNITSQYPTFTSDGADTITTKTIQGSSYAFSINQVTGDVYNADSLPYATKVDKVTFSMGLSGYAKIYVDSLAAFDAFLSTDSIDFTSPRIVRITSTDGEYYKDYTVSVNVHQVEPEKMVWNKYPSVGASFTPLRALDIDNRMCLFGKENGQLMLATTELQDAPSWTQTEIAGLPENADLATVQPFRGALYVVAADGIYKSTNGSEWSLAYGASGMLSIVGTSDNDGMWMATADELFVTYDGDSYESAGALPAGFPVYGVSIASYVLEHNSDIVRYMLVGYGNETKDAKATVWSRLSTEDVWVKYENGNKPFQCPSLKGLTVLRYDDFLYAFGGAGTAQGEEVDAFSAFYISRDNGITWKAPDDFYQRMPAELQGCDAPFVATVDSNNMIWIVCAGEDPFVFKGMINRLGFKK
jgi:hypothetical protein